MLRRSATLPLVFATLAACVQPATVVVQDYDTVSQVITAGYGRIIKVQSVTVRRNANGDQLVGALVGGVAGGVIARELTDDDLLTGAGVIAGAIVGGNIASQSSTYESQAWTVRLDNGRIVTVIQRSDSLRVGMRVKVVQGENGVYLQRVR
jgi:outer membrane lipoprotein SlyB